MRPIFLSALVGLLTSACVHKPKPIDFGLHGEITDATELFEVVRRQTERVHAVRGEAKAKVETPQGGGSLTQFVIAERPDRLRLESIDFFGRPVALLTADGVRGSLLEVERNVIHEGPATAQMVAKLLPIHVAPHVVVDLLTGGLGISEEASAISLEIDTEKRVYVLVLSTSTGIQRIGVDPRTLLPVWTVAEHWQAKFEGWKGDAPLPGQVTLATPDARSQVTLTWRDTEIDPEIDASVFQVERPPGAEVRRF